MKTKFLPQITRITTCENLPKNITFLIKIANVHTYPDDYYSFFKQGNYLSIINSWPITPKNKPAYTGFEQIDLPLAFLPWFITKFDFFLKPSTQGGMPANKIMTDTDLVAGEDITISRAMDAGNSRRDGGYTIDNFSRREQGETIDIQQNLTFSDSLMFEGGLLDLFKDLAQKYQNGTL